MRDTREVIVCSPWLENFRNAEVQQSYSTIALHEHIAGFQVAVHDQVAVRILNGACDVQHQLQALLNRKLVLVAIDVDR